MKTIMFAAMLASTALGGAALAAQTQPAPSTAHAAHRGHHGGGLMKLDANKDGVITRQEAIAAADAVFAKGDTNGDGQITREEIKAKNDAHRAKRQERRSARAESSTAATPDGKRRPGMRHHRRGGAMMLKRMDADNNGSISRQEAQTAALARFGKMDANGDGRIDAAEITAMRDKMKARFEAMKAKRGQRQHDAASPTAPATPGA